MIMTTTTVTTTMMTTTASTSSSPASRSVSFSSVLDLCQSSAEGKNDESLSSQKFLVQSPDNSITIQADVSSSPSQSLHTTQNVISTCDQILSRPISTCTAASSDLEAIEVAPELLLASPTSQQDAILLADIRSSDAPELVIGNRDSSLTEFLYPNVEFVHAFPAAIIEPIPNTGALMFDVIKLMPWSNIFCVISSPKKCVVCTKKMTVHFSYQSRGMSYIYDKEKKKEIVQPYKVNDTVQLAHNDCMSERTNEGHNNFFRIFEEECHFQIRRSIKWSDLIKIIFVVTIMSSLISTAIYLTLDGYNIEILILLWLFATFINVLGIMLFTTWGKSFIEHYNKWSNIERQLKLVIWKPSSIPTVEPIIISPL